MARIIAGLGSPHAPSIGALIDKGAWQEPGWEKLLDGPIEDILDVLTSQTPRSRELRANSPFAGVLSSEERERALLAFQTHQHSRV